VTYKTAWFMAHRLRFAMTPNHWAEPKLKGIVEVDETFVGGRGEGAGRFERQSPVVALVERGGTARVKVVASVTQKNLGVALQECVDQSAVVNTDEHPRYKNPLKAWKEHHAVNHSRGEYQRKNADGSIFDQHRRIVLLLAQAGSRRCLAPCLTGALVRLHFRSSHADQSSPPPWTSAVLCICEVYNPGLGTSHLLECWRW